MTGRSVTMSVADHVATVTLDRPPVNAVDTPTMRAIRDTFAALNDRRDVRVAIFTGAGQRAFMGGVDLHELGPRQDPDGVEPAVLLDRGKIARDAMWAITDCPVPVIGAINGPAIGAGLAFAACCDILLAADHAFFQAAEINVGLLGASAQLSLLVGRHKAREMFFLGERVAAADLHRLGVIRAVVPSAELMASALDVAGQLATKSPIALRLAKESMNRIEGLPLKDAYRLEQDYTTRLLGFEDSTEARRAYVEKRDPIWRFR